MSQIWIRSEYKFYFFAIPFVTLANNRVLLASVTALRANCVCVELDSLFKKLVVKSSKILNPVIVLKVNCKPKRCVEFKSIC